MTLNAPQTIVHLEGDFGERRIKLDSISGKINKEFIINDNKSKVLTRKNRLPVVLFEPSELRLISSSPSRRRDFLDGLIARLDPKYDTDFKSFQSHSFTAQRTLKIPPRRLINLARQPVCLGHKICPIRDQHCPKTSQISPDKRASHKKFIRIFGGKRHAIINRIWRYCTSGKLRPSPTKSLRKIPRI